MYLFSDVSKGASPFDIGDSLKSVIQNCDVHCCPCVICCVRLNKASSTTDRVEKICCLKGPECESEPPNTAF